METELTPISVLRGSPQRSRKRLLLVCLDPGFVAKLAPAFRRIEFEIDEAPTLRHATKAAQFSRFDLLIVAYGTGGPELGALLEALRTQDAPNLTSRVAIVAPPEDLAAARELGAMYAAKAIDASAGQLDLQETALDLLRSRARLAMRVMTRLAVRLENGDTRQLACQSADLSRSGLFVVTESRIPLGASLLFRLDLPEGGDGIHGEAQVVRHSVSGRDRSDGVGLRFLSFAADGERRLHSFLTRHLR